MISGKATIGAGTVFGENCVVEDGVILGKNCRVGHFAVLHQGTEIGDDVRIDDFACLGKQPMKAANSAVTKDTLKAPAKIGSGCLVGTGAVIYAGTVVAESCLIADLATVREDVSLGEKTIVGRGACIENQCTVGCRCKIETNAYICAYSKIGDDCFVAPCAVTSNDNYAGRTEKRFSAYKGAVLKRGARVGAGAVLLPGKEIAEDGFAAAGSVLTKSVGAGQIVAGNPAAVLRDVPEEQLLPNQRGYPKNSNK